MAQPFPVAPLTNIPVQGTDCIVGGHCHTISVTEVLTMPDHQSLSSHFLSNDYPNLIEQYRTIHQHDPELHPMIYLGYLYAATHVMDSSRVPFRDFVERSPAPEGLFDMDALDGELTESGYTVFARAAYEIFQWVSPWNTTGGSHLSRLRAVLAQAQAAWEWMRESRTPGPDLYACILAKAIPGMLATCDARETCGELIANYMASIPMDQRHAPEYERLLAMHADIWK